jgi:hypothetical protein
LPCCHHHRSSWHNHCHCHHHGHRQAKGGHENLDSEECCGEEESHDDEAGHGRHGHISEETKVAQLEAEREALQDEMALIDEKIADLQGEESADEDDHPE